MIRTLLLSLFILPVVHDFHFSRTRADYNIKTNTLQMSMNVFTDDLELAVSNMGNEGFKIDLEFNSVADSLIGIYALKMFTASHDTVNLKMNWIGYECDYDITYLYVESEEFDFTGSLTLDQNILMDTYSDQENVLDFSGGGIDVSHILTKGRTIVELSREIE